MSQTPALCYKPLVQAYLSNLFSITAFLLTLTVSSAVTNTIVVPRGLADSFGTSWSYPFSGLRESFEQIYASTAFTEVADQTLIITEIAFRVDESDPDDFDSVIKGLLLTMNTFTGSLAEIMERRSGAQIPMERIFYSEDVRVSSRAGEVQDFNVRFPLDVPFIYSPRNGHLVLIISKDSAGVGSAIDADDPEDVGFSITREPLTGTPEFGPSVLVTKFSYFTPPEIVAIRAVSNSLEIDFTYTGVAEGIQVQSAPTLIGPYTPLSNVKFDPVSTELIRALVPLPTKSAFFRIRQNLQ